MDLHHQSFNHLLRTLEEYGEDIDASELRRVFESRGSQEIANWVQEFLTPDTLLSRDEAALYLRLEEGGLVDQLQATHDLEDIKPIHDHEIRDALLALDASTSTIEQQDVLLRAQYDALLMFQRSHGNAEAQSKRVTTQIHQKQQRALQTSRLAFEEILEQVRNTLSELTSGAQKVEASLPRLVDESFKRDDQQLLHIEKAARNLYVETEGKESDQHDRLCAALAGLRADNIRTHLDRVYLETICSARSNDLSPADVDYPGPSLESEIDSLYEEIGPVTDMSIEQEYASPFRAATAKRHMQLETNATAFLNQASLHLTRLLEESELLKSKLVKHDLHLGAIRRISEKLATIVDKAPKTQSLVRSSTGKVYESEAWSNGANTSPQNVPNSLLDDQSTSAARKLLRILGIRPDYDNDPDTLRQLLDAVIVSQGRKTNQTSSEVDSVLFSIIGSSVKGACDSQRKLIDSLLIDTLYGNVKLSNPDLESRGSELERKVGGIGSDVVRLNLEKLHENDETREEFVDRWGAR